MNQRVIRRMIWLMLGTGVLMAAGPLGAQVEEVATEVAAVEEAAAAVTADDLKMYLDLIWVVLAAALVFSMQAGFAYVEGGFTRAKNANNIMMKNLLSIGIGTIAFFAVGFALMFGDGNAFLGTTGFFMSGADNSPAMGDAYEGVYGSLSWSGIPLEAKLFFQLMFAATAGTIVSGAMAERTKFSSYLIATVCTTAFIYPVVGHWGWGGGWLGSLETPFSDFAGSTIVHMTGGVMAFMGAYIVGARKGKYGPDGSPRAIPGHSIPMATLGVFILWLGWFGFNAGSTMGADASIGLIALNTNLAAAAGAVGAMVLSLVLFKTYDVGMTLNGVLCGLVGITAGCAAVSPVGAIIIGFLGGALVVVSVVILDKIVDDPVGAISVHGVGGAYGTICVGLFATEGGLFYGGGVAQLVSQVIGVLATLVWVAIAGGIVFFALKATIGLRVDEAEEFTGLDLGEHGLSAYPDPGFVGGLQSSGSAPSHVGTEPA
jgi:Amt family ammonium transporter